MPENDYGVAKTLILIDVGGLQFALLSRKKAKKDPEKHGKLEFLGGGMDSDEPLEELCRELEEEEQSGELATYARSVNPTPAVHKIGGRTHHIFEIRLPFDRYLRLIHDPKESLGLKLVPLALLVHSSFEIRLTPKTRKILKKMELGNQP